MHILRNRKLTPTAIRRIVYTQALITLAPDDSDTFIIRVPIYSDPG